MAAHGYNKFFGGGRAGTAGWFDSIGMKPGMFHARVAASTEMAAGLGLAVGLLTPIPAAGFVALMLVAAWTVHRHNGFFIVKEGWEYNLILAVTAVAIAGIGAGKLSLDYLLFRGTGSIDLLHGWCGLAIAVGAGPGRRHRPAGDLLPPAGQGTSPSRPAVQIDRSTAKLTIRATRTRSSLAGMGFLKQDISRGRLRAVEQGHPRREDRADGPALGRGRIRDARRAAPVLRREDPALHPRRVADRADAPRGIDGFTNVTSWYAEPIVFQKVVLYTMLFEVVGLGCGFGPLNNRFFPPMGSILYWLRPKTIRLPPWPNRIPLTKGDTRTPFDVLLYAALLVMLVVALFSDGTGPIPELGTEVGVLPVWQTATILGLLAVAGLRDKVIFLAARGEVYASLAVCFLFSGRRHHHRRQAGLPGDLAGRGDVQAQQALPVRHLDDDEQQPGVPAALDQAEVLRALSR